MTILESYLIAGNAMSTVLAIMFWRWSCRAEDACSRERVQRVIAERRLDLAQTAFEEERIALRQEARRIER
jgi:hypothetical protein